jgi:F0F1-type ATP synthase beta subunit
VTIAMSRRPAGKVLAIRGAVVDVAFAAAELPRLEEALIVEWDRPQTLMVEVQAHLDQNTVRGVALQATISSHLDSVIVLSRSMAAEGMYLAVDPLSSSMATHNRSSPASSAPDASMMPEAPNCRPGSPPWLHGLRRRPCRSRRPRDG